MIMNNTNWVISLLKSRITFWQYSCQNNYVVTGYIVSNPLVNNSLSTILWKERVLKHFWWGDIDGKGVVNFWRFWRFLEVTIINLLHKSYFTYCLRADWNMLHHSLLFTFVCSLFCFIKSFFNSVWKFTQESVKISKISYFFFSFKLKETKKVPLKNMVLRDGVAWKTWNENHCWTRICSLKEGLELLSRGLDNKGVKKIERGLWL